MGPKPNSQAMNNTFTAYGDGHVYVNTVCYAHNVIVMPDHLIEQWTKNSFDMLTLDDMQQLASLNAEIILLGTGRQLRFPRSELMQPLVSVQKGLDVMDIHAACRAYNLLASEGRRVAAALLFD